MRLMSNVKRLVALVTCLVPLAAPRAMLAESPAPQRALTMVITDGGFDQQSYVIGTTTNSAGDTGLLTIVNKGKQTHTATQLPGSPFKVGIGQINFFAGETTNIKDFDTGGLGPGQSITVGVPYPGTYRLSSATDCLNGNRTPGFNCEPVTISVVAVPAGPVVGSAVSPGGSCARLVVHEGTPTLCVGQDRLPGQVAGSSTQGVGDVTVTIDDVAGYQPSIVYLKAGSSITWVNKGSKYHGVKQKIGTPAPDGFHALDAGALDPGESYKYTFTCPPGPTSALTGLPLAGCTELIGPFEYLSNVGYDANYPSTDGFGTTYSTPGSNGSLYTGAVYLVP
jgi:plastocyanin